MCAFAGAAVVLALVPGAEAGSSSAQATVARPLVTGVMTGDFVLADKQVAFQRTAAAGARFVRLLLFWQHVAPTGATRPPNFDARNPGEPRYRWAWFDDAVKGAVAAGLQPVVNILHAPAWAQGGACGGGTGTCRPSVSELTDFAIAAAQRYGGGFQGLPRVRYWMLWNEPNLDNYLRPQFEGTQAVSPELYRSMVNAMHAAIRAVRADNQLIAGGLAPFGGNSNDPTGPPVNQVRVRPLQFMREMLCMSGGSTPRPTCAERANFDIWAHHPYTYGGPTRSAHHPDDVSMGDLATMRKLLVAAKRAGRIQTRGDVGFWVTEFSYDSKPGDPKGLGLELHTRWVSEALYRMWSNGVTHVTWFLLRDEPFPDQYFQSGLYMRGPSGIASDTAKPALRSFRFPFVAFRNKNKTITYWGRSPSSAKAKIVIEQSVKGKGWKRVLRVTTNRYGIFTGKLKKAQAPGKGPLRAKLANGKDFTHGFGLRPVNDFRFCPWGSFC
jgi:Cellulase (glycosyl hydrolase family 5)